MDQNPILDMIAEPPGQNQLFNVTAKSGHLFRRIAMIDPDNVLLDDGTGIKLCRHIMAGGPYQFDAAQKSLTIGARPGK